jgi:hypothetical protein
MTEAPVVYRGTQAAKRFLECLEEEEAKIKDSLSRPAPMDMTDEDVRAHNPAQDCHVCRQRLNGDSIHSKKDLTEKGRQQGLLEAREALSGRT